MKTYLSGLTLITRLRLASRRVARHLYHVLTDDFRMKYMPIEMNDASPAMWLCMGGYLVI